MCLHHSLKLIHCPPSCWLSTSCRGPLPCPPTRPFAHLLPACPPACFPAHLPAFLLARLNARVPAHHHLFLYDAAVLHAQLVLVPWHDLQLRMLQVPQATQQQNPQVVVRTVGIAGHLHSIHLENFMCHENFSLELGWVVGWVGGRWVGG